MLLFAVAAVVPAPAHAHTALGSLGSFWAGVAHLLTSPDQVGFLLGLAIWASFAQPRADPRIVMACFGAVLLGAVIGLLGAWHIDLSAAVAALMIAVGLAGAARLRIGAGPILGLAVAGGVISGVSSGEEATGLSIALFSLGGALAAAATVSYGLIVARRLTAAWAPIAFRAGASWIAAIGLMIFALDCSRYFGRR